MISRLYRPRLLYDDFNIRLPSSEWSSSEVKINIQTWHLVPSSPSSPSSSSRSGCEDIFINKQLTGHSHAFAASLPLRGLNGLERENGGQGSERRPGSRVQRGDGEHNVKTAAWNLKLAAGRCISYFVLTGLLVQRYLTGFMPRYSPMLTSDKRLSGLKSNLFVSESEINISLNVQPALL